MEQSDDDVLVRFGRRLRQLRSKAGYSQEKFALHCDLDRTYVGSVERGKRNVSLRNLERFAERLGITLAELFEEF